MRIATIATLALSLAACSNQPKADDDELEDFRPPTVHMRGDVVPNAQRRFERLDKNNDGFVTPDEFANRGAERVKRLDGDGDGRLSRSELVEGALKRFDAVDINKDGQITPDEASAARTARGP